jgi:hypothetical protein
MSEKFTFGQGNWLKPVIGIVVFLVVVSVAFRIVSFLLPLVILGALIFFSIKLIAQNGSDRERWGAWGEQFSKQAERLGEQFSEQAERWGRQMEQQAKLWAGCGTETTEAEPKRKNESKRKNDEDVLEIEHAEPSPERGKAKRRTDEQAYL